MNDRITPKTAIRGFLDNASISKSVVTGRSRVRRSSASAIPTTAAAVQLRKRKSESFSELTPRTLIQGVIATTDVAPDTARKRPRMTPKQAKKALTPGTVTRSTRKRVTRLDVLATPGSSNPTPRSLIQGLLNTAPVETPWHPQQFVRRTSPRTNPDFPTVAESLQKKAQVPSLSPFIKDPKSLPRPGGRRLRSGLRRGAIDPDKFAAGIDERLSQEEAAFKKAKNYVPESLEEFPSFEDSGQGGETILESIQEEEGQDADMSISEEEKEEEKDENVSAQEEEEIVEKKDAMRGETEEPADPVFVPVSVDENQPESSGTDDQPETAVQEDVSNEEGDDTAEQTTMIADGLSVEQSTRSDADGESSTENEDQAVMPTQPTSAQRNATPRSARRMGTPRSSHRMTASKSAQRNPTPLSARRIKTPGSIRSTSLSRKSTPVSSRTSALVSSRSSTPGSSRTSTLVSSRTSTPGSSRTSTVSSRTNTPVSSRTSTLVSSRTSTPVSSRTSALVSSHTNTPVSSRTSTPRSSRENGVSTKRTPNSVREGTPQSIQQSEIIESFADVTDEDDQATASTSTHSVSRAALRKSKSDPSGVISRMEGTTLVQTTLDGYSPLVTPRIDAHRRRQTPAVTKTPAPPRISTSSQETVTHPKKKPPPRRKPKPKQAPSALPPSLTKGIFAHFSRARVSKEALAAAVQGSNKFFNRVADDLMTYAVHAHRQTIEISDVELLMRRQRLITDKESLHYLIEEYLPLEYRQELIPIARAGNKVYPKLGTI